MGFVEICNDIREIVFDHDLHRIFGILLIAFLTIMLFCAGYGYAYPSNPTSETVIAAFSETSHPEMFTVDMWLYLTSHNFWIGVAILIGSFVATKIFRLLSIVPFAFVILQAACTGCVVGTFMAEHGLLFVVAGIICHGIIEIPTIILAGAFGYFCATTISGLKKSVRYLGYCVVILFSGFFVAGFIETFITPVMMVLVSGFI